MNLGSHIMLGVVACVRNPSAVMTRWDVGWTVQLTKGPVRKVRTHTQICPLMLTWVLWHIQEPVCVCIVPLTFASHTHQRVKMNKTVNRKEDFIFPFSSLL